MSNFTVTPIDDPKAVEFWKKRKERDAYFSAVRRLNSEYTEEYKDIVDLTARPTVHYWVEEKYGFAMATDGSGNYTADYTITDPKKFMMFQIKYGM